MLVMKIRFSEMPTRDKMPMKRDLFPVPPMRHIRHILLMVASVLLVVSCGGGAGQGGESSALPDEPYKVYDQLLDPASTGPYVAAHRGAHDQLPENSLAALREAARLGADFVEVDVRHTQDGVLVLMHDESLYKTTGVNADVSSMTYAQIQELTLWDSDASDPETMKVPTFAEAEALAREKGIMLYVDMKTSRKDLVLAAIQAGPYDDVCLLRASLEQATWFHEQDANLLLMPLAETIADLNAIIAAVPGVKIVELEADLPDAAFCAAARAAGVKVQQNVIGLGDIAATLGDDSVWAEFVKAGVWLLQTDQPGLLVPRARKYRQTGVFP